MSPKEQGWISTARTTLQASPVNYFQIKPLNYWFDFFLSLTVAYTAGTVYLTAPLFSWPQLLAFPVAVFWIYRLGSLVHEVAHLPHGEMRLFKVTWNLLAGVVLLEPSPFFTRHHRDHHTRRMYGTIEDPEYVPNFCQPGSWLSLLVYVGKIILFPLVVFLRFLLVPLSYLHPRLREFILTRASSLTMNWRYKRKLNLFDQRMITGIEWLCFIRALLIPLAVYLGWTEWTRLPLLYVLAVSTFALNQLRFLADHHLQSSGETLSWEAHILDSCNYSQNDWLTWLFFPFAIRYHALHHLFPTLPYHNLSSAHAYLLAHLPVDSPYHSLDQPGWWSVARNIFKPAVARSPAIE